GRSRLALGVDINGVDVLTVGVADLLGRLLGGAAVLHAVLEALHRRTEVRADVLELLGAKHHHHDEQHDQPVPNAERTHDHSPKNAHSMPVPAPYGPVLAVIVVCPRSHVAHMHRCSLQCARPCGFWDGCLPAPYLGREANSSRPDSPSRRASSATTSCGFNPKCASATMLWNHRSAISPTRALRCASPGVAALVLPAIAASTASSPTFFRMVSVPLWNRRAT